MNVICRRLIRLQLKRLLPFIGTANIPRLAMHLASKSSSAQVVLGPKCSRVCASRIGLYSHQQACKSWSSTSPISRLRGISCHQTYCNLQCTHFTRKRETNVRFTAVVAAALASSPGMSNVSHPVWDLRAVIWFHFAIASLVLLPSPIALSILYFSACWSFFLNFFQKNLQVS